MRKMKTLSIILLTIMLLCACGNPSGMNENTTIETETKNSSDFLNDVELGATRGEVAEVLNTDGLKVAELKTGESQIMVLQWISADSSNFMQVTFENGKVIGKKQVEIATESKDITMETFNKMKEGMAYNEVKEIAGSDGILMAETKDFKVYGWMAEDGASISVIIKDDKVESLAQHDLK